jgi:DnaJ-domain-containing protein 1
MEELRDWRYYMDSKRFEELLRKEEERKARERQRQEEYRKAEEARKAQEERNWRANQAREEQERDRYRRQFEEEAKAHFEQRMNDSFEDAMFYGSGAFKTGNQRFKGGRFEDYFKTDTSWYLKDTWFAILGVPASADKATIKSAWRKLAKVYHPDRNPDPKAGEIMAKINKAKDDGLAGLP